MDGAVLARTCWRSPLELAQHEPMYGEMALKFAEHFLWIAAAMDRVGDNEDELWDEGDGFFYDVLRFPDGSAQRLKVRSMVGCCRCAPPPSSRPTCAPAFRSWPNGCALSWRGTRKCRRRSRRSRGRASATAACWPVLSEEKLRRILRYVLDENEFLGPHGIRALSRHHLEHPFALRVAAARRGASATSRPSRPPASSAATPTGAGRCGCR